jgi:hypothetical protein
VILNSHIFETGTKLFFPTQILNAMKLILPTNFSFIVLLTLFAATLSSCEFGNVYTYDLRLERPVQSQNLQFENDTISISFALNYDNIGFKLFNKLDDAIKINWKDISVSIDGETKVVVPSAAYTTGFPGKETTIMVAPRSTVTDIIQTTNKWGYSYTPGVGPTAAVHTYPVRDNRETLRRDYILGLKGRRFIIFLPYYVKDTYCSQTFELVIADVQSQAPPKG